MQDKYPNAPAQPEWLKVIGNLERGAASDPDPAHRKWCKGQLKHMKKRYAQVAAAKGWN